MSGFTLRLAPAANASDCLAEPLISFLRSAPWVGYLTLGDVYLSDVNDDPELEDEYDAGLGVWVALVQAVFEALSSWSEGVPVRISHSRRAGLAKLIGRRDEDDWAVETTRVIDPELLESMATYGWEASMWTVLPEREAGAIAQGAMATDRLEQLIAQGNIAWWLSHGYKEPFLTGDTPSLAITGVCDLISSRVGIPVQVTDEPFVPHRVRLHRGPET